MGRSQLTSSNRLGRTLTNQSMPSGLVNIHVMQWPQK